MSLESAEYHQLRESSQMLIAASSKNDRRIVAILDKRREMHSFPSGGKDQLRIEMQPVGIFNPHGLDRPTDTSYSIFDMTADLSSRTLKVGPVYIPQESWRGKGFGSFVFSEMIEWAQNNYPEFTVLPLKLTEGDGLPPNGPRRNAFYRNFGFVLVFQDDNEAEGRSMPITPSALTPNRNEKVATLSVIELLHDLGEQHNRLGSQLGAAENRESSATQQTRVVTIRFLKVIVVGLLVVLYLFWSSIEQWVR